MLVLSRRLNESIMIGDEVEIKIVDVRGDQVRIGVQAPRDIPVHRKEVYAAIQRQNLQASAADVGDVETARRALDEDEKGCKKDRKG